MKKYLTLIIISLILMSSCDKNRPEVREATKAFVYGTNGGVGFTPKATGEEKTEYGYSTLTFRELDNVRYAVFSVPANEPTSTSFTINLSPSNYNPYYLVGSLKDGNATYKINGIEQNYIEGSASAEYAVSVSGTFSPYEQENMIVMGFDNLPEWEQRPAEMAKIYGKIDPAMKNLAKANSAYIAAYPWRDIIVNFTDKNGKVTATDLEVKAIKEYADKVFRQAICRVRSATAEEVASNHFDCTIRIAEQTAPYNFYDERDRVYSTENSNELKYAIIDRTPTSIGKMGRNATMAIAYLLGVSKTDIEINDQVKNLMDPTGTNDEYHLTFRQWNQLHN